MPGDSSPNDLGRLWKELRTSPLQISPDQLRKQAGKLQKRVRRSAIVGGAAGLIVIAAFLIFFLEARNNLQRIGCVLTILGSGLILGQLRTRSMQARPDVGRTDCSKFYRVELQRQRDFHRGKWFWSRLVTFLPGPMIFLLGGAQAQPELAPEIWRTFVAFLIVGAIAIPLNLRLARKYQRRIDALDTMLGDGVESDKTI